MGLRGTARLPQQLAGARVLPQGHPKHICIPHLGASTEEAEENSAAMAADTVKDFLETGTIRNSVNFPNTVRAVSAASGL